MCVYESSQHYKITQVEYDSFGVLMYFFSECFKKNKTPLKNKAICSQSCKTGKGLSFPGQECKLQAVFIKVHYLEFVVLLSFRPGVSM